MKDTCRKIGYFEMRLIQKNRLCVHSLINKYLCSTNISTWEVTTSSTIPPTISYIIASFLKICPYYLWHLLGKIKQREIHHSMMLVLTRENTAYDSTEVEINVMFTCAVMLHYDQHWRTWWFVKRGFCCFLSVH